jgi:hypothetical protein
VRFAFSRVYRDPNEAFGSVDFRGLGRVSIADLMRHALIRKLAYKFCNDDLKLWLSRDQVFDHNGQMNFESFKRHFFPKAILTQDRTDVVGGPGENWEAEITEKGNASMKVQKRLNALDKRIRQKFSTIWVSVRKAFLEIDQDRDGLVSVDDICRFFTDEKAIDLNDL